MTRLQDKVALVTGAARGQGRSHAVRLAEEGADVVALDLCGPVPSVEWYPPATPEDLEETASLVEKAGRRAVARRADVRDLAQVQAVVEEGLRAFGRLDVVVANAGIVSAAPAAALDERSWADVIDVNLSGVWHTVKAALPSMIAAGRGGSIVLTSSANGGLKAPPNLAHYASSKFGLVGLMRSLANELGPHFIRVNTVHPTAVNTDMIRNEATYRLFAPQVENPAQDDVVPAFQAFHALPIPWVEPVDVSNAVVWLASDEARYVTGVALPVDAGLSAR